MIISIVKDERKNTFYITMSNCQYIMSLDKNKILQANPLPNQNAHLNSIHF